MILIVYIIKKLNFNVYFWFIFIFYYNIKKLCWIDNLVNFVEIWFIVILYSYKLLGNILILLKKYIFLGECDRCVVFGSWNKYEWYVYY